jgi:hypothetical protein
MDGLFRKRDRTERLLTIDRRNSPAAVRSN